MRLTVRHGEGAVTQAVLPAPAVCVGFQELVESWIGAPAGGPWTLRIDDEAIPLADGGWRWTPGYFAGEVAAELAGPAGEVAACYRLDVSPDPGKLGQKRFQAMQDEILSEDPALLAGNEPAATVLGADEPLDGVLEALVAFSRLRQHAPPFIRAVREASRQPRTVTRKARAAVELHRTRRADTRTVQALARSRAASLVLGQEGIGPDQAIAGPIRADVPWCETTVDCAANRCVVAIIGLVRRRVTEVRASLLAQAGKERGETRTALDPRLAHREQILRDLDASLWRLLQDEPWRQISRPEITAAGLNALAADPRYARVNQLGWKALRRGVGGDTPEDRVWLSPTWEIFERWCFVRLARLVRERHPELAWTRRVGHRAPGGALAAWVGQGLDVEVAVLLQPHFPSWDQLPGSAFRSVSRERSPDLLVTARRGASRRWAALDAKYRRARQNVLEAMESAHIYKDSLRWNSQRPDVALLFVPAEPGAGWLTAPAFHQAQRVGAWVLDGGLPPTVLDVLGPSRNVSEPAAIMSSTQED